MMYVYLMSIIVIIFPNLKLYRHPLNKEMRSPVHNLNWFQYFLLDVLCTIFSILFIMFYIVFKVCSTCCCKSKKLKHE